MMNALFAMLAASMLAASMLTAGPVAWQTWKGASRFPVEERCALVRAILQKVAGVEPATCGNGPCRDPQTGRAMVDVSVASPVGAGEDLGRLFLSGEKCEGETYQIIRPGDLGRSDAPPTVLELVVTPEKPRKAFSFSLMLAKYPSSDWGGNILAGYLGGEIKKEGKEWRVKLGSRGPQGLPEPKRKH